MLLGKQDTVRNARTGNIAGVLAGVCRHGTDPGERPQPAIVVSIERGMNRW